MDEIITLQKQELENGCIQPWIYPVVMAALKAAKLPEGRTAAQRALPRFLVKVDGQRYEFKQERTLAKFLLQIAIGAKCRVFRNRGLGATINFDL